MKKRLRILTALLLAALLLGSCGKPSWFPDFGGKDQSSGEEEQEGSERTKKAPSEEETVPEKDTEKPEPETEAESSASEKADSGEGGSTGQEDPAQESVREESDSTEDTDAPEPSESPEESPEPPPETEPSPPESESPKESETVPPETLPPRDPDRVINLDTTLYTYEMMSEDLQYFAQAYPDLVTLTVAGVTEDYRNIYAVYFGNRNAGRQIFICAATHAREYMTTQLVMKQLEFYCAHYDDESYGGRSFWELFRNTCIVLVPMINPDGVTISQRGINALNRQDLREHVQRIYESDRNAGFTSEDFARYQVRWKANAMGVDINRNFSPGWESVTERTAPSSDFFKGSSPGSERESQALMQLIDSLTNPILVISYHSYGDLVYWQYGQPEPLWTRNQVLAQHISDLTGHYLAGYSNEAGFTNWCIRERGIPAVVVETGTVPTPLPLDQFPDLWQRHRYMWAMLAATY